jgi:hypothetical protein
MRVLLISMILVLGVGVWESRAERVGDTNSMEKPAADVKMAVGMDKAPADNMDGEGDGGSATASLQSATRASNCTRTYANVKRYLKVKYGSSLSLPGTCANHADQDLLNAKFRPTGTNLETSTIDTVCVFGGGHFQCNGKPVGTIAVRKANGWYDGCNKKPEDGLKNRPLIGCYKRASK